MAGKAASSSSQFVGQWMATSEGAIETMEFGKDGKVIVSDVISSAMGARGMGKTFDYKVLEGGRLSMVAPDGMTAVYDATVNGDQLEIRGELVISDNGMQRFRRLKAGETVQAARQAEAAIKAKAYQERVAALNDFLKQPGLILAFGSTGMSPGIAVEFPQIAGGQFSGKAWHEGQPPHLDQISGQLVMDERNNKAQVRIIFGPQVEPVPLQNGGGQAMLDVTGDAKNLKVAGKVQYGSSGTPMDLVLKADAAKHDEIVKKFQAELARIEAMKQPVIAAMKDFAIISGKGGAPYQGQPDTDDYFVLVKADKPGTWRGEGTVTNPQTGQIQAFNAVAARVEVIESKAYLMVLAPGRQYQLTVADASSGKLDGGWFMPGNPQGKGVDMKIVESADAATRAKQVDAMKKAFAAIGTETKYYGVGIESSPLSIRLPLPIRLTLSSAAGGNVTGKVFYPSMRVTSSVNGTIIDSLSGPRLQLKTTAIDSSFDDQGRFFGNYILKDVWTLAIADGSTPTKLAGSFQNTNGSRNIVIEQRDEAKQAKLKQQFTDLLTKGTKFSVKMSPADNVANTVEWKLDPATGKVAGKILEGGRMLMLNANSTYTGELKEQDGWTWLVTTAKTGNQSAVSQLMLVEDEGKLHLYGYIQTYNNTQAQGPAPTARADRWLDFTPVE